MSQETILVTGAAGSVGSTARGCVTWAPRSWSPTCSTSSPCARPCEAARCCISRCRFRANYLEAAANVAVTAKSLGVKAFVNLAQMTLSQMSATETTSSPPQKQEWLAEQMLRWSGLPVVYLRPTAFFDGLLLFPATAKGIRDDNVIRLPFADGRTSLIAAPDVGAAAAAVLANPEPHIGKVYDMTGPQSLTMTELAQEFSGALGRTIQYVNVPPQMWETKIRKAHLPAHLTAHLITMAQLNRDGRYDRMTHAFQQLVGRAPISAAEFARRHAAAFTPA